LKKEGVGKMGKIKVNVVISPSEEAGFEVSVYKTENEEKRLLVFPAKNGEEIDDIIQGIIRPIYQVETVNKSENPVKSCVVEEEEQIERIDISSVFQPNCVTYAIPVKKFENEIVKWLKNQRNIDVTFDISYEGPDDYGYLGDIYVSIDESKTSIENVDKMNECYGEERLLQNILEDFFFVKEISYDFNINTEELIVHIAYETFLKDLK